MRVNVILASLGHLNAAIRLTLTEKMTELKWDELVKAKLTEQRELFHLLGI